jgi:hypothetical protein
MKKKYYVIIGLLLITNLYTCSTWKSRYTNQSKLITAYQDTLKRFKTKDGKNAVKKEVLVGSPKEILNVLGNTNKRLSKLIKDGSSSGVVIQQTTKYDTITQIRIDTVQGKLSFADTTQNNWLKLAISLQNDSLTKSIELKDSISVSFIQTRNGLFKPKKNYVVVSNANPYVKIGDVKSFEIPKKKSKSTFWVGLITGAVTGYFLFK